MPNETTQNQPETEEIDVTEICERIDALEKENSEIKIALESLKAFAKDLEESIDALVAKLGEE